MGPDDDHQPRRCVSRLIHHEGWTNLLEPYEAGQHDPPMQEWLQLPVDHRCPVCRSTHWGTKNAIGYFLVRQCHDEFGRGCRALFREEATPEMIQRIVSALCGHPVRLWARPPQPEAQDEQ